VLEELWTKVHDIVQEAGIKIIPKKKKCKKAKWLSEEALQISEVIDMSPGNLDSSLCFIQPIISHDVLCI